MWNEMTLSKKRGREGEGVYFIYTSIIIDEYILEKKQAVWEKKQAVESRGVETNNEGEQRG